MSLALVELHEIHDYLAIKFVKISVQGISTPEGVIHMSLYIHLSQGNLQVSR